MYLLGFTLNIVTLLSLSLVVGILVDDAIVEIENIMRHLRMGKTPFQAAMEAADEIGLAVIATTFTLVAVFLPTAFMSGVPGKFFVQFGWTAAIAVFFSLVVARMLTPMMAAYLLKRAEEARTAKARWIAIYMRWVALVPAPPRADDDRARPCSSSARSRWCRCCRPASSRPTTCRRRRSRSRCRRAATFEQTLRRRRSGARDRAAEPARQAGLHRGRRRQRPAATRSRRSGAAEVRKATLTLNLTPRDERGGVSKQAIEARAARARSPRCPARASRSASAARARSTCWCWPARTAQRSPRTRAQVERELRTHSRHRQRHVDRRAWCGPS